MEVVSFGPPSRPIGIPAFEGISINGQPLDLSKKTFQILNKTSIAVKDLGEIVVDPQIKDHGTLIERLEVARINLKEALQNAGAPDLSAARFTAAQRKEHVMRSLSISKELVSLCPGNSVKKFAPGLENLKNHVGQLRGRLNTEKEQLGLVEIPDENEIAEQIANNHSVALELSNGIEAAEARLAGPSETLKQAETTNQEIRRKIAGLSGSIESKNATLTVGRDKVSDAELSTRADQLENAATEKREELKKKQAVEGEPVEVSDSRIKRLEGAIANHQNAVNRISNEITRLATLIQANEGIGVEEQLLTTDGEQLRLTNSVAEFKKEAMVLELLLEALNTAEGEAKTRYLVPVISRVEPYLKMLLPGANIVMNENLGISAIQRDGQQEDFAVLSGGTREQLAILTRLAFAELLRGQGRPAMVILDDALAFSDDDRIENMFDVLMRAGGNLQIIVLTCRKKLFSRLGATPIGIGEVS